ncbi:hypothetical protein ACOI1H_16130 [Loktanella sp. DJP18]|uniref:hypothetical protein n=1 Tax=Loktanella sp. DJP18 TaxID=3409788 RepID=UPI003BB576B8
MGVIISGYSANNDLDFSADHHRAIDDDSISLSEGNWREHLAELFFGEPHDVDMPAARVAKAADDFIDYTTGRVNLDTTTLWHIDMAGKVTRLAKETIAHGGDTIGIAD